MNRDFKVKIEAEDLQAANLARLLAPAEVEAAEDRTRPADDFLKEFKLARDIQG